jgi:hypothetical protein
MKERLGFTGKTAVKTAADLRRRLGSLFSGKITDVDKARWWADFELILPKHISSNRIIKVIKAREPNRRSRSFGENPKSLFYDSQRTFGLLIQGLATTVI